jgi:hypothetical protein
MASWRILYDQLAQEEKNLGLVYILLCLISKHHLKMDNCSTTSPFWDIPEGESLRKIFTVGRTSSNLAGCLLWEKRSGKGLIIYQLMHHVQLFVWMVRDLKGT